jgi:hypothetical protein
MVKGTPGYQHVAYKNGGFTCKVVDWFKWVDIPFLSFYSLSFCGESETLSCSLVVFSSVGGKATRKGNFVHKMICNSVKRGVRNWTKNVFISIYRLQSQKKANLRSRTKRSTARTCEQRILANLQVVKQSTNSNSQMIRLWNRGQSHISNPEDTVILENIQAHIIYYYLRSKE